MDERYTLPCAVVRDLLPLYHDAVVSAETRSAVGEHLMGCDSCRAEYEAMKKQLPEQTEKSGGTLDRFRALMKRQKRKKIIAIVLAAVLAACAAAGCITALNQLCIVPVSAKELAVEDVCFVDTPEGRMALVRWTDTYGGSTATKCRVTEGDDGQQVDIGIKHPVLEWVSIKGHEREGHWFVPAEEEIGTISINGRTVWSAAEDGVREDTGYALAYWQWEQAMKEYGGLVGWDFAEDYLYLRYPDGHEEYWTYDGELLEEPPARDGGELDWSLEMPPPAEK